MERFAEFVTDAAGKGGDEKKDGPSAQSRRTSRAQRETEHPETRGLPSDAVVPASHAAHGSGGGGGGNYLYKLDFIMEGVQLAVHAAAPLLMPLAIQQGAGTGGNHHTANNNNNNNNNIDMFEERKSNSAERRRSTDRYGGRNTPVGQRHGPMPVGERGGGGLSGAARLRLRRTVLIVDTGAFAMEIFSGAGRDNNDNNNNNNRTPGSGEGKEGSVGEQKGASYDAFSGLGDLRCDVALEVGL